MSETITSPNGTTSNGYTNETFPTEFAKKKLIKKQVSHAAIKKKAWLAGHLTTIVFGSIAIIFQALWLPNKYYISSISYRLTLIGAMVALAATFSHKFGLRSLPSTPTLMSHQNFQYLILSIVWCFTFKSVFKLLPFLLIAILHVSEEFKVDIVLKEQDFLASLIAYDELVLIVYLLLRTLLFRNTSGFQLTLFISFYWLRILYNKETGNLFRALIERLDGKVQGVKNPKVLKAWNKSKAYLKSKEATQH
ncbi:uncharacterized membrane protein [[Candida] railenensis]|uniref:Uncharacterized membrane protein n=1 Tax=[Candida] railenensis TaxID=45579 RepID=A0A9P0QP14_9ASCO|nr:uncharacterized membrane protein [[Candida] railenensis]